MKHFLVVAIVFTGTVMLSTGSTAQESSDWPPDPADIFAPSIKVIESEAGSPFERRVDYSTADNEARVIRISNETNQKEYPYPDGIDHIDDVHERADGTFLVLLEFDALKPTPADKALILDPTAGTFSEPTAVCDNQIQDLPDQGSWRFYPNYGYTGEEITEPIYLCFTETGEMYGPLPEGLEYYQDYNIYSPDGEWVVFIGFREKKEDELIYTVYSYHVSDDQLTQLGVIETNSSMNVHVSKNWISNTEGLVSESIRGPGYDEASTSYYSFDASEPDSLQFVFTGWPTIEDDPVRYTDLLSVNRFAYFTGLLPSKHFNCQLRVYDADGFRTYDLGYDCVPMGVIGELFDNCSDVMQHGRSDFYYLRIDREGDPLSTLVHLDLETDQLTNILEAEIETIAGISPDQRYMALVIGDNRELRPMNSCHDRNFGSDARIHIYDTQEKSWVYYTEGVGLDYNDLNWIDRDTFILYMENVVFPIRVREENDMQYAYQTSLRVVTLEPLIQINEIHRRFPRQDYRLNGHYLLSGHQIFNIHDWSIIPLVKDDIEGLYEVVIKWLDNDNLTVYVYRSDDAYNGWRYTIRVPALSES